MQGLNNAVALDFDYREQMIYWTDVTTQGSMIRRMHLNGSNVQVRPGAGASRCPCPEDPLCFKAISAPPHRVTARLRLSSLLSALSPASGRDEGTPLSPFPN